MLTNYPETASESSPRDQEHLEDKSSPSVPQTSSAPCALGDHSISRSRPLASEIPEASDSIASEVGSTNLLETANVNTPSVSLAHHLLTVPNDTNGSQYSTPFTVSLNTFLTSPFHNPFLTHPLASPVMDTVLNPWKLLTTYARSVVFT